MFFAGGMDAGTVALWRELHSADPHLLLLGSSSLANESFAAAVGGAGAGTYLTTPMLASSLYPPSARRVLSDYRGHFGAEAGPYALYGYEAMSVVLDSIRGAGSDGNDREAVIDRFFAITNRDAVIGRYSMQANGETTQSRYGVDRVVDGRLRVRPRDRHALRPSQAHGAARAGPRGPLPVRRPVGLGSTQPAGRRPSTSRKRSIPPPRLLPPPSRVVSGAQVGDELVDGRSFGQPHALRAG